MLKRRKVSVLLAILLLLMVVPTSAFAAGENELPEIELTHALAYVAAQQATCTEDGIVGHYHCSICEKCFSDAKGSHEIAAASTVIAAKGHAPDAAWSYDDSAHWHACARCDAKLDAASHTWDEGVVTTEPTQTTKGTRSFTCLTCGDTKTEEFAPHGFWQRLAGSNRYQTMAAIVREGFKTSRVAVLASGKGFPDALVASALAGAHACPVVLTAKDKLSSEAADTLKSLGVREVYVMGGTAAISQAVEESVAAMGIRVRRVDGATRQATSSNVMDRVDRLGKFGGTVVVATGSGFADALSIGPWCYANTTPILLTGRNGKLNKGQANSARKLGVSRVVVVGGTAAISQAVEESVAAMGIRVRRVDGATRQATSSNVMDRVDRLGKFDGTVVVATGSGFADALSIGPWCYANTTPILLTGRNGKLNKGQANSARKLGVSRVVVVGGTAAVSDEVFGQLGLDKNNQDACVRLSGSNRYATSAVIAAWELEQGMDLSHVAVATGATFPDALAGAALCGINGSPLVLAANEQSAGIALLRAHAREIELGSVLGGSRAVSEELLAYLRSLNS